MNSWPPTIYVVHFPSAQKDSVWCGVGPGQVRRIEPLFRDIPPVFSELSQKLLLYSKDELEKGCEPLVLSALLHPSNLASKRRASDRQPSHHPAHHSTLRAFTLAPDTLLRLCCWRAFVSEALTICAFETVHTAYNRLFAYLRFIREAW